MADPLGAVVSRQAGGRAGRRRPSGAHRRPSRAGSRPQRGCRADFGLRDPWCTD